MQVSWCWWAAETTLSDAFRVLSSRQGASWQRQTQPAGQRRAATYDVLPWAKQEAPAPFALWRVAVVPGLTDGGSDLQEDNANAERGDEGGDSPEEGSASDTQGSAKFAELVGDLDLNLIDESAPSEEPSAPAVVVDEQALEEARQEGLAQGHAAGLAEGLAQGQAQGQAQAQAAWRDQQGLLAQLVQQVPRLSEQLDAWREPMRELALHLAEQLVRSELRTSGEVVARLVQQALDTLEQPSARVLALMHPDDAEQLMAMASELPKDMRIQPDPSMTRGSVRVSTDDTLIEDLMSNRLQMLAQALLSSDSAWASRSVLLHESAAATSLRQRAQDMDEDAITDAPPHADDEA
jgi:flagellar biosynthesis/type III secretory pathway protein FliH